MKGKRSISILAIVTLLFSIWVTPTWAANITIKADNYSFTEGQVGQINLTAEILNTLSNPTIEWEQIKGPKVPMTVSQATYNTVYASLDTSNLEVAVDTELTFKLTVMNEDGTNTEETTTIFVNPEDITPILGENIQIGGGTNAVNKFVHNNQEWAIFNIGGKLCTQIIDTEVSPVYTLDVAGYINDIDLVDFPETGQRYALLSCGSEGLYVVDISNPQNLRLVEFTDEHGKEIEKLHVSFRQERITFAEGGGSILYDNVIESSQAPVTALAVYNDQIFIADSAYGLHRVALNKIFDSNGQVRNPQEPTLADDAAQFTLQYAGENPWGGPVDIKYYGGKLFVSQGFLGMGIYDPETLEQVGGYNLYTDSSVVEDWFIGMDVQQAVYHDENGQAFVDPFTGMPDYRQTNFEITQVMKNRIDAPTPWADFDRYGKYYYNARSVDIAQFPTKNGQPRTIAYIAYSLGGLIAVDITGFERATSDFKPTYLGYVPAVPANGPDAPSGTQSKSLLPYYGAGMLKESGIIDVQVRDNKVYLTDHFAGLVIIDQAANPDLYWHGPQGKGNYNNDIVAETKPADKQGRTSQGKYNKGTKVTESSLGDHWPDYEFVTSYDMSPYDASDNESMPKWMYEEPCLLVTAEINGHGNKLLLMDTMSIDTAGGIDLLECAGAGGFNMVDLLDLAAPLMSDRYAVSVYVPTTAEIGANVNGFPDQTISIGHSGGITSSDRYIYVADGPHGVSAWKIVDQYGYPTDEVHLVANTLQDEYPQVNVDEEEVYPASHANNVVFDEVNQVVWTGSSGLGLRRVQVKDVEADKGQVGSPLILPLAASDCFEHNAAENVKDLQYQDHAYDSVVRDNYVFVADGSNGLTVYDYTKNSTDPNSGFVAGNVGAGSEKPPLGTASGLALWSDAASGEDYAFMACGPRGIGVVDVTDVTNMQIIKVFEPIKMEDGKVGAADGQAVDVKVVGDYAYFTYDSFGVICYEISKLIEPLPDGINPTEVWKKSQSGIVKYDYRPEEVKRFKLQYQPGYETVSGGAVKLDYTQVNDKLTFYVAFAEAGVAVIDWTDPKNFIFEGLIPTVGDCSDVTISNGRLYVADGTGGLIFFK